MNSFEDFIKGLLRFAFTLIEKALVIIAYAFFAVCEVVAKNLKEMFGHLLNK